MTNYILCVLDDETVLVVDQEYYDVQVYDVIQTDNELAMIQELMQSYPETFKDLSVFRVYRNIGAWIGNVYQ